jgi:hypothetical protein
MSNISKICADFLRTTTLSKTTEKLKATHAHELVAALFGYRTHAALLADQEYPLDQLEQADIFAPDVSLMNKRREDLGGLPTNLPDSKSLAQEIIDFLTKGGHFSGSIWWISDTLENYIIEEFLPDHDFDVMEDLSGQMAETNAYFDETHYEEAETTEDDGELIISVTGQCNGSSDPEKPYSGDQIDMTVTVSIQRVAGRNAYAKPSIRANGEVNWDWADKDYVAQ